MLEAGGRFRSELLFIDDTPNQTMLRIGANARRLRLRKGIRLVIVDYLQLIEPEDSRAPRAQQVGAISRRLKLLARELQIPVVALSQLNRSSEDRQDHRPRLADLRESGSLEQDADTVVLLYREDTKNGEVDPIEVMIAKQRNGPIGELTLAFRRSCMRFENWISATVFDGPE